MSTRPPNKKYSLALVNRICERVADGETLISVLPGEGIGRRTFYSWLDAYPEARGLYEAAVTISADAYADQATEIADDASRDEMETDHGPRLDREHVRRSELRVRHRWWLASKRNPARYGDRQAVEHSGAVVVEIVC